MKSQQRVRHIKGIIKKINIFTVDATKGKMR